MIDTDTNMPRKTLALISGLVIVTIILFAIALRSSKQPAAPKTTTPVTQAEPTTPAHSVLSLSPNPVNVAPGQRGSVDVVINTSDNAVTAIQLELAYDPTVIGNIQITPGQLFKNPVILINKDNPKTGQMTYAFGIAPNNSTVNGVGAVATISFVAKRAGQSQLTLLPTTLVTARGVRNSVLKTATGTTVIVGSGAAGTTTGSTGAAQPLTQPVR